MFVRSLCFLLFLLCFGCQDNSPLVLNPIKRDDASHLGKGVYLTVPALFDKATSYDGYQMVGHAASISVDIVSQKLESVKKSYDPDVLSRRKNELLEIRPVEFGGNKMAFYSKVRDKRKKTVKYLLAIANGGETYLIKAFCFDTNVDVVGPRIERALKTTFIGEKPMEEQEFLLAKIYSMDHMIYTRDGNFPTESKDNSVVEHKVIKVDEIMTEVEGEEFLKNEMSKIVPDVKVRIITDDLIEGSYQYVGDEYSDKNVFLALFNSEKESLFIKCTANTTVGRTYFKSYIEKNFLKMTLTIK